MSEANDVMFRCPSATVPESAEADDVRPEAELGEDGLRPSGVPPVGFEPTTNGLKVHCANQAAPQGRRRDYRAWPDAGRGLRGSVQSLIVVEAFGQQLEPGLPFTLDAADPFADRVQWPGVERV